jgi:hypothetical protein
MVKPCLCSGSLAYVHIACLNQWRTTSESAYNTCSICHFTYRTRRSTIIDLLLQYPMIVSISLLMTIFLIFLFGFILCQVLNNTLYPIKITSSAHILNYLYSFQFPDLRQCAYPSRLFLKQLPVRRQQNYLWKVIENAWIYLVCHSPTRELVKYFMLGAPVVGSIGHLVHNIRIIQNAFRNEGGWVGLINVTFLWFGNDIGFMLRLYTVIGCGIFLKDLIDDYSRFLRKISQSFGVELINATD